MGTVSFRVSIRNLHASKQASLCADDAPTTTTGSSNSSELAKQYLKALGGHSNISTIDACITRLRLTLNDTSVINEKVLKDLGAMGVVKLGSNNVQVILGPLAEIVAGEMKQIPADADLTTVELPS